MDAVLQGAAAATAAALPLLVFVFGWFRPDANSWLVVPRIFQWGSRGVRFLPSQTALGRTYNYEGVVVIVGAGAAGLAAGRVLEENKIRYFILEATERYGGRVKADTTFADFPIDLGAEWIHNLPGILPVLGGGESAATQPELVPYHLQDTGEWDGEKLTETSQLENDFAFRFFPEYKFKRSTWYEFVDELFATTVESRIQYSSPVVEVDYSGRSTQPGQIQLMTASGESFVADKVIMTTSVGVLRSGSIRFVPALSAQRQAALEAVEFPPGFKLLLKFSEKFYSDAVNWPLAAGAVGERGFYDMAFKKDAQTNVLGFLTTGAGTEQFCKNTSTVPMPVRYCFFHVLIWLTFGNVAGVQTPWSPRQR
eukprot:SAG25_NODE_1246_length_3507_cov_5.960387_3_plen_367_part_00